MDWSAETSRRVLDYSLRCPITDEEIEVAESAIEAEEAELTAPDAFNFTRMTTEQQDAPCEQFTEDENTAKNEAPGGNVEPQTREVLSEDLLDMLWVSGMRLGPLHLFSTDAQLSN